MKKILVCPDSFKGCLTAKEVADCIEQAIRELRHDVEVIKIPLADGGEGTGEILSTNYYQNKINVDVNDPMGHKTRACYFLDNSGSKAFIESASAIGLPLIKPENRNIWEASSCGLGEIIKDAVNRDCKEISVALGGTGTSDCGMGMLEALGYCFKDSQGNLLRGCAANLKKVSFISSSPETDKLKGINFTAVCDVINPLTGPSGAVNVYALQKGASPGDLPLLEKSIAHFAKKSIEFGFGKSEFIHKKGSGAAGGIGFSMFSYLDSSYISGIDFILDISEFEKELADTDLIITGEGKIDAQSLMGKVLKGVLERSRKAGVAVKALCGTSSLSDVSLFEYPALQGVYPIADSTKTVEENMEPSVAIFNLKKTLKKVLSSTGDF